MPGFEDFARQTSAFRELFVDEAFDAAQQVQHRAQDVQTRSQSVPLRAPVEGAAPINNAGMADKLFWFGLGSIGALAVAYVLIKRGD